MLDNCRICMKNQTDLINTTTNCNSTTYNEELFFCVPEIDWKCTSKPSLICKDCRRDLKIATDFRRLCLQSDELRRSYIEELNDVSDEQGALNNQQELEEELSNKLPDGNDKDCKLYVPSKRERTCRFCKCTFSKHTTLANHIRSHHTFEKCYKCELCGEGFTNSEILSRHKNRHTNERKYVCSYCGKKFFTNSDLNHHVQRHQNKRNYKCNICENKSFNTANSLRTHKLVVHTNPNEWKYLCPICGRKCVTQTSLTVHMKRHSNEKDFSCHLCSKNFCTKSELSKHISSHSNMRLHKCEVCNQEYKDRRVMERHLTKKHGIGDAKIVERVKKFGCNVCPKKFIGKRQLEKHLRSHSGVRPFKCEICEQAFICSSYIKGHMRNKHPNVEVEVKKEGK